MALLIPKKAKPAHRYPVPVNGKQYQEPLSDPWDTEESGSHAGRRVSEEEYWERYYLDENYRYEWNDGILEQKPVANVRDSIQYLWFCKLLVAWLDVYPQATILNLEIGFRLRLKKKTTIRKPDVFVVRHDNPAPLRGDDSTFKGICDICVESVSHSSKAEIERDTVTKVAEYGEIGVREYYILDSVRKNTAFYRQSPQGGFEANPISSDGIVSSQVLPGFQFRVEDIYRQPSLITLVGDPVYQHYVHLDYQKEKARAETELNARKQAEAQAASERLARSQVELQLANALAQLRALGIEP